MRIVLLPRVDRALFVLYWVALGDAAQLRHLGEAPPFVSMAVDPFQKWGGALRDVAAPAVGLCKH